MRLFDNLICHDVLSHPLTVASHSPYHNGSARHPYDAPSLNRRDSPIGALKRTDPRLRTPSGHVEQLSLKRQPVRSSVRETVLPKPGSVIESATLLGDLNNGIRLAALVLSQV